MDFSDNLIPIIGIIAVFGMPIIIAGLIVFAIVRRSKMQHELRMEIVKSGKELPIEWEKSVRPRARTLLWGIIIAAFGAALQIIQGIDFFADLFRGRLFRYNDSWDYFSGLIFIGIGLGLIYYHKYQEKHGANGNGNVPAQQSPPASGQ